MAFDISEVRARYHWDTKTRGAPIRKWRLFATDVNRKGSNLPHRCYADEVRAHNAALVAVRWGDYRTIEVYNAVTGLESGTYKMSANGAITFSAPWSSMIAQMLKKKGVPHG